MLEDQFLKTEVCSCSGCLTVAMLWIKEVEVAKSVDDVMTSQSIEVHAFLDFEMLGAKIASAVKRIITNQYFRRRFNVQKREAQAQDRFLRGRQIPHMIYENFRASGAVKLPLILQIHSLSLYKEMTVKILVYVGTKLYFLQVKYPRKMSWRVCTR